MHKALEHRTHTNYLETSLRNYRSRNLISILSISVIHSYYDLLLSLKPSKDVEQYCFYKYENHI